MSSQFPIALAVTFALIFSPNVSAARAQQKSLTSEEKQVVDTVSTIFTAARTVRHCIRLLYIRWRRAIQWRLHHGIHQGPACGRQAL
jgi:hypothetical protein